uniref:Uncharacterized protein n=1 Tax=Anguilla anguilla TaxID=7936 RepID=A0A0E9W7I8_ANGAN
MFHGRLYFVSISNELQLKMQSNYMQTIPSQGLPGHILPNQGEPM